MGASIETSRLNLRWLDADDAGFILRLLNDADWLHFIGDKNVANPEQAKTYIENGPRAMYRQQGFGLNRVALRENDTPIGICGLLQRETLQYSDLGFAFLPAFRRQGYAYEAARAVLQDGFSSEARFSSRQKNSDGTKTGIPRSVPYRPRNLTHVTEITRSP